ITLAQARQDAVSTAEDARYSTAKALNVLRRLHAAATQMPVPVAAYAPVLPPTFPVTITPLDDESLTVRYAGCETTVAHEHLVDHLQQVGVAERGEAHQSLIVDTPSTLGLLGSLARSSSNNSAASVLDWWLQRAEHPGSGACYVATDTAPLRWVTGQSPTEERDPITWATWLQLPQDLSLAHTCEAIVRLTAEPHTLDGLLECHSADSYAWKYLLKRNPSHRRSTDTRRDAAMGLTTRNHAAEYYTSLRMADPLAAQTALREGHLVHATVQPSSDRKTLHLLTESAVSRFRVGAEVQGWRGTIEDATSQLSLRSGIISTINVTTDARLAITIEDTVHLGNPAPGSPLTLRPRSTDAHQQGRLRIRYNARLRDQRNWVSRTSAPPTRRRTVPLDVVVAAAADQD
ncbi:MAG: hypothetical protein WBG57_08095, partial [Ornithinimicrobium sp.]